MSFEIITSQWESWRHKLPAIRLFVQPFVFGWFFLIEQTVEQAIEALVIWDAILLIMTSLKWALYAMITIGSGEGLPPLRCQAIISTKVDVSLIVWRHQAITWASFDVSSMECGDTDMKMVSWEIPICKKSLKNISLTHWGRVTHICVGKLIILGSDNGLSPGRRQAIIWTNAEIMLIGPLGTNFSEILIAIQTFHSRKCVWKCRLRNGVNFVSASMC